MKVYTVLDNVCGTLFAFSTLEKAKKFILNNYADWIKYASINFPQTSWENYEEAKEKLNKNNFIEDFMYIDEREIDKDENYLIDWENT